MPVFQSVRYFLFALILCLLAFACEKDHGGTVIGQTKSTLEPEESKIVGQQLTDAIADNKVAFKIIDTVAYEGEYQYLTQLLQMASTTAEVENRLLYSWQIHILRDDVRLDLFTSPDGHFYITTGLLKYLQGEHELIGLLSHEIMYVDRGEVSNALIKTFGGDRLGELVLGTTTEDVNDMAEELQEISYKESLVMQADSFSNQIVCPFLYDPLGLHAFVKRAYDNQEVELIQWLNKRGPVSEARIERLFRMAENCGDFGKTYEARYQAFLKNLP